MSETVDGNGGGRISVSRDALRAELAELRLTLMTELRLELDRKASITAVDLLDKRVYEVSRRTDVLEDKSRETEAIASALLSEKKSRLTGQEKTLALSFALVTVVLNVLALGPDLIHRWLG